MGRTKYQNLKTEEVVQLVKNNYTFFHLFLRLKLILLIALKSLDFIYIYINVIKLLDYERSFRNH